MIAKVHPPWMAWSPDGIAILDTTELLLFGNMPPHENRDVIASIEIKTSIAESSLNRAIGRAKVDTICCTIGEDQFKSTSQKSTWDRLFNK